MVAMLEEVVQFGTGVKAKAIGRPSAGKTGTTNDFTDAWYIGFTPTLTAGVWVGNDDKRISLGKKETGAQAALPIWIEFMQGATGGTPVQDFANVTPLEKVAPTQSVHVDTADTAPPSDAAEQGLQGGMPQGGVNGTKAPTRPPGSESTKPPR
jgi:penicillin-binding protein 1A